ncbi:MAG: class B sortase [Clostridiales bacterium]|nr:class B sortase [Clostridiales bacterium]
MKMRKYMVSQRCVALFLILLLIFPAVVVAEAQETTISSPAFQYTVDFPYLQSVAPDAVAWLYQPNTTINQPVLYSADRRYYLRRSFDGDNSRNGSIFITEETFPDLSAPVLTLRGNNCMDDSFFGSLSNYREVEYYQQNPTLFLVTPEGTYQLDIFAGYRGRHSDKDSWVVTADDLLLPETLPAILEKSFITPDPSMLPEEGDAWVILTTEEYNDSGTRYVIYTRKRPLPVSDAPVVVMNQLEMDSRQTQNGYVTIENVGTWMVYAQNDPSWNRLTFEVETSSRKRPFGDGGCGPTSVAIALANLVDKEDLVKLNAYASMPLGYRFCACSINDFFCKKQHVPYRLTTADQFLRYLPLAIGNYATGNNTFGVQGRYDSYGTSMSYLQSLCEIFGLSFTQVRDESVAYEMVQDEHTVAIGCASGSGSPFTRSSHFLVIVHVDDEYVYVLDPLRRDQKDYAELDFREVLEFLAPGVLRIKIEDALICQFSPLYVLSANKAEAPATETVAE